MVKVKRTRKTISLHRSFVRDEAWFCAEYQVDGADKLLYVEAWAPQATVGNEVAETIIWEKIEKGAQWAAAHPDEVIEAKFVCT